MIEIKKRVNEIYCEDISQLSSFLQEQKYPIVIRGLVKQWPIVKASESSEASVEQYLRQLYHGVPISTYEGPPSIGHRYFYDESLTSKNFTHIQTSLDKLLDNINACKNNSDASSFYMGSTTADYCLPNFTVENPLPMGDLDPLISLWIGNQTRVAAHYDVPDNIACVAAGKRRFIVFPPEQLPNLYIGPIDHTPAGQSISLVDFHQPDFDKFPRFKDAIAEAQMAELAAGDAIFIPSMWWHHVEGLSSLNVLVNYWWRETPKYLGQPMDALHHALLTIRDLPIEQRKAWQGLFEHYIFNYDENKVAHIPEAARGILNPLEELNARKLRSLLMNNLNR